MWRLLTMRKFIRHPANVPIEFKVNPFHTHQSPTLHNISIGGLSFQSNHYIPKNTTIQLCIPTVEPPFQATAVVVWCNRRESDYLIGVKFIDQQTAFRIRMIEQICHIEGYRKYLSRQKGIKVSGEEAANEWIAKFAKDFPSID
jgi:hypothetical protein